MTTTSSLRKHDPADVGTEQDVEIRTATAAAIEAAQYERPTIADLVNRSGTYTDASVEIPDYTGDDVFNDVRGGLMALARAVAGNVPDGYTRHMLQQLAASIGEVRNRVERDMDAHRTKILEAGRAYQGTEFDATAENGSVSSLPGTSDPQMQGLLEYRDNLEDAFDVFEAAAQAAEKVYVEVLETPYMPYSRADRNRGTATATMLIDAKSRRDAERRKDQAEMELAQGFTVTVIGDAQEADYERVFRVLDGVLAKHENMILVHGGARQGLDMLADRWAKSKKVPVFKVEPDFKTHGKGAPYRKVERMIQIAMASQHGCGAVVFNGPDSGTRAHFIKTAREMRTPLKVLPTPQS